MATQIKIVPDISNENNYQPWIVCFSAALFFFFEFMNMVNLNAISSHLIKEFNLTAVQFGQLAFKYFLANIIFLIPAGIIIDRVSTRTLIVVTMSICVAGSFGFAIAPNLFWANVARFMIGMGGAFCFLSNVRLATRWFLPERMALVIGLIVTMAMIGGTLAQAPFALLADKFGWRYAFFINAISGLFMLFIILLFVRDYPKGMAHIYLKQRDTLESMGFFVALKKSFGNLQNWLAGIYTSFMNFPIMALGAAWGDLYLIEVHKFTHAQASSISAMIFLGSIIGSPFWGWLSDRVGLRKKPMILAVLVSIFTILIIMFVPGLSFISLIFLFFILGFFTIAQIISYPLIAESNPKTLTATSESIASFLIQSGGLAPIIFGFLMELRWNHLIINGKRVYSPENFLLAMGMIPVAFGIALIAALLVKETHCRSVEE